MNNAGLFSSFGGPARQISVMQEELVERMRWISERRVLHAFNYCLTLLFIKQEILFRPSSIFRPEHAWRCTRMGVMPTNTNPLHLFGRSLPCYDICAH